MITIVTGVENPIWGHIFDDMSFPIAEVRYGDGGENPPDYCLAGFPIPIRNSVG
jgi:hypothetical protein